MQRMPEWLRCGLLVVAIGWLAGVQPAAGQYLSGSTLFGMTSEGGIGGGDSVFDMTLSQQIGPAIKANGATETVSVIYPNTVSIAVEMNAGSYAGVPVDWWILACAHAGDWYYLNSAMKWASFNGNISFCRPVYQGSLDNRSSTTVLNISLPCGSYEFFFAIDYPMDGILNLSGPMLCDSVKIIVKEAAPSPSGFVLIPAGSFIMGDTFGDGSSDELPTHSVTVSAFYMESTEVTKAQWDKVYAWAISHGYSFDNAGLGKAADHPVHSVNWYDAVKWCNARSEKDGLTPCYYTTSGQTTVYRTGDTDISSDCVNWSTNGYRLPTEAEWEKAARGGAAGHRFPWSDADTITHSRANYDSSAIQVYDVSPTWGYHPTYATGRYPFTSPAGVFAANGYGLYEMAGNVSEWCWDEWSFDYYSSSPENDPRGATFGLNYPRVFRGGNWYVNAYPCRSACRSFDNPDSEYIHYLGFRCARSQ